MSSSTASTAVTAEAACDAAATAPPAGTGARTAEASAFIGRARERIDDLDRRILGLVEERMAVSAEIQQARLGSGGRRVHLAREMEIINHYSGVLGRPGTTLAMTLLELCRGRA